jgi:hypothetical protein
MTLNDLQRAALVLFAARKAGPKGSLDQMRAICHVLKNRAQAGWADNYLSLIESSEDCEGNEPGSDALLDLNDRRLQQMAKDVDDIYFGAADDEISRLCARQAKDKGPLLYWVFVDRPIKPWFRENIIARPQEHFQRGIVGFLYLYE